jgi:hypothetical protein
MEKFCRNFLSPLGCGMLPKLALFASKIQSKDYSFLKEEWKKDVRRGRKWRKRTKINVGRGTERSSKLDWFWWILLLIPLIATNMEGKILIVPYCLFWTLNLLIFIGIAFCKFIKFCRIDSIYFGNFVNHLNWNRIFKDLMKYLK